MHIVMTAYGNGAYAEFRLPVIDNTDYALHLSGSQFGLHEDMSVSMEVVDGRWFVKATSECNLIVNGSRVGRVELAERLVFTVEIEAFGDSVHFLVTSRTISLSGYTMLDIRGLSEITIGKDAGRDICYDNQGLVSRQHARIVLAQNCHIIEDTSSNGVFVNGVRIKKTQQLNSGDSINILGLKLVYLSAILAVSTAQGNVKLNANRLRRYTSSGSAVPSVRRRRKKQYFKCAPRVMTELNSEPVEIEAPPQLNKPQRQPLFMTIGPAFTMMIPMMLGSGVAILGAISTGGSPSIYMYTGIIVAVASAVIGVTWALINLRYSKKKMREDEHLRFERYKDYLINIADKVRKQYEENGITLHNRYPSAAECCKYDEQSPRLWNRNPTHSDFMFARTGLGDIPFQVPIVIPKERFTLIDDSLAEKPRMLQDTYRTLKGVPVGVDLREVRILGIFDGGTMNESIAMARTIAMQLAVTACYTDVKLVFLYDEGHAHEWEFARWLPHVWSEDHKMRYVASCKSEANDVLYALASVLRQRCENASLGTRTEPHPYYVVFVDKPDYLDGEPVLKYLLDPETVSGISTVFISGNYETLPNRCENLIQCDSAFCGMYDVSTADSDKQRVRFDFVSAVEAEACARRLSRIRVNETETGGELTTRLDFFEMYGITALDQLNVADRWRKNRTYESMKALIGQKAGGKDFYLDIHEKYHGPHGLVAGTTGSGKSETLQTYILSLALNFSPLDVAFFIIDFKGGGMANLFSGLPHMVGQISNLSGNQVRRAMMSIKSEIKRRQRIFGEYDVNHLDMYTRLLKSNEAVVPIPHLLIIIDEFAELKREEPDFMRELISVAQVGRSLGIHLILATQKPAGTVDDNIWSNSKFRICLRVQDRQDSMDMLKKPDAAYITQAGRGYMQVGNDEIFELFQSGWSGAVYDEDLASSRSEIATMLTLTGQPSIAGNKNKLRRKEQKRIQWMLLLADRFAEAIARRRATLLTAVKDNSISAAVVDDVFTVLAASGVDYQRSKYNTVRLTEFLELLSAVGGPPAGSSGREKWALAVMTAAAKRGQKLPEIKEKTQLDAMIEYLGQQAVKNGMTTDLSLWLPLLPTQLYLSDISGYAASVFDGTSWRSHAGALSLEAAVGLYDDPVNQTQQPLTLNFAEDGHIAVCGMVVSGKSTFMQTFLYSMMTRYSPEEVSFYILDYSSRLLSSFADSAHCGGVIYEDDTEKAGKLFAMLQKELARRKLLFQGGSYAQYVRVNGTKEPALVIVIDGFANFREKTDNCFEDVLTALSRDGANYGIYLTITAAGFSASEIYNRIGENFKTVISLQMGDKLKYSDVLRLRVDTVPETGVVGRGLAVVHESALEFQTALACRAQDDYQRSERIRESIQIMNAVWRGKRARPIPEIPAEPVWEDIAALDSYRALIADGNILPFAYRYRDAEVCGADLSATFTYLIAGKARTGKSSAVKCLMAAAHDKGGVLTAIDLSAGVLESAANAMGCSCIRTEDELSTFARELFGVMVERNKLKKELRQKGLSDSEVYEAMISKPAHYIFIDDLADFTDHIYGQSQCMRDILPFMENFFDKGALHNIYVFAGMPLEAHSRLLGRGVYDRTVGRKCGILLGGGAADQRLFDMSGLSYHEQSRMYKPGVGLTPPTDSSPKPEKVIIPMYAARKGS